MGKVETLVTDRMGTSGTMEPTVHQQAGVVTIRLQTGVRVQATIGKLLPLPDGTYRFDGRFEELQVVGHT